MIMMIHLISLLHEGGASKINFDTAVLNNTLKNTLTTAIVLRFQ